MALLPEQISAQVSYPERQRSQIDAAINTLREAHRRLHDSPPQGAGFPSDPAIKVGPEIVGRVFRQGPACFLTVVRDAVVTAICRRFDNRTFEADPEHGPVL
jgi:hypothetical protein